MTIVMHKKRRKQTLMKGEDETNLKLTSSNQTQHSTRPSIKYLLNKLQATSCHVTSTHQNTRQQVKGQYGPRKDLDTNAMYLYSIADTMRVRINQQFEYV